MSATANPLADAILEGLPVSANGHGPTQDETPLLLPETFWTARSGLTQIRQAAHSRTRSADVVFHAVLARIAAAVPHTLKLPAIVGSPASLCYFVAVVGPPASGKSSSYAIAGELVPVGDHVVDSLPVGSGEGMVEVLFDMVKEKDPVTDKWVHVKRQVKHNAIVYIDEGDALTALGAKSGATTLSMLRSAWSGHTLGQTNASNERKRIVPAGQHSYGLVMALQPTLAGPLLEDVAAGTPQRFGWAWAIDPTIPDDLPAWPGRLALTLPVVGELERIKRVPSAGYVRHEVTVAPAIVEGIRRRNRAAARGEMEIDAHDAHADLLQLKVAALLAILDGRIGLSEEDWELAGVVKTTSVAVRRHVQGAVLADATGRERALATKFASRAVTADDATRLNRLDRAANRLCDVVSRHGGEMLVSQARRELRSYRDVFEEAIDYAVDRDWLTEESEPSHTGDDKRILRVVR